MTDKTTEQVQAKSIVVANIGGYNYTQGDLNNVMFAFTLHSIHKNTGIDFHTFASFEASIQGAILSAVTNMENNKVGIVQYREAVEAATNYVPTTEGMNTHQPCPTDYDRASMYTPPYGKQAAVPPWMQNNTPAWVKAGMGMPTGNIRQPAFNIMNLHDSLRTILVVIPFLEATSLSTYFDFQGRSISVSHALKFIYEGIKQNPAIDTNQNKF